MATGNVHRADHVASWKTLVPCAKDADALMAHLRSHAPVYVVPFAARSGAKAA